MSFPRITKGGSTSAITSVTGTAYVQVSSTPLQCYRWTCINLTGTGLIVKRGVSDTGVHVTSGQVIVWEGCGNLQDFYVKRGDNGVTQVTVEGAWEDF
jgi:hypothetical protein